MTDKHITSAMRQWATRPDDERFWTVEEMQKALADRKSRTIDETVKAKSLRAEGEGDDFRIIGPGETEIDPTNWAMRQLGQRLNVGTDIFSKVSGETAASIFNDRIERMDPEDEINLLLEKQKEEGQPLTVRAVVSSGYSRIMDADIAGWAKILVDKHGFKVPPARPANPNGRTRIASEADVLSTNNRPTGGPAIRVGDTIGPAGLYAGDRDMFITLVRDDLTIVDPLGNPLNTGLIISNSEVGAKKISITQFMFRGVCGNHCYWNCSDVLQVRYRHVGNVQDRIKNFCNDIIANGIDLKNPEHNQMVVDWMARNTLGTDKQTVIETVYGFRMAPQVLTKKVLGAVYDESLKWEAEDGQINSWWSFLQVLTRYSQNFANADERFGLDLAAAELYNLATRVAS